MTSRDAHSATWESVEMVPDPKTGVLSARNRSFIEIGSGINYRDANGVWQRTEAEFREVPGGFAAERGWSKVFLADNLNQDGAVQYTTPEGLVLKSAPLCLGYFDPVTGESIVFATLHDTFGRHAASNNVEFPNAFKEVSATVRYEYRAGSFHQDVVLLESPPPPTHFNLSEESRLELITTFTPDSPVPTKTVRSLRKESDPLKAQAMVEPDFQDEMLHYGEATDMVLGRAFALGEEAVETVLVGKQYQTINGTPVLIEGVEYKAIEPWLRQLPAAEQAALAIPDDALRLVSQPGAYRSLPLRNWLGGTDPDLLASRMTSSTPDKGLVMDYGW